MYYLGMKARDGKLFMGVFYEGAGFVEKYNDTAYVAVIDLATAKIEKLIKDFRTGSVFLAYNSFSIDKSGDIYVAGLRLYQPAAAASCALRKGKQSLIPLTFSTSMRPPATNAVASPCLMMVLPLPWRL